MTTLHRFLLAITVGLAFAQAAAGQDAPVKPAHRIELAKPLTAKMTLEERLEAKQSFQAERATLRSFAKALEKALDTSVMLIPRPREQPQMFQGGGIPREPVFDTEMPLTYKLKNVRVRTALKLILEEHGLTYYIDENVLLITTFEDAWERLVIRVYHCRPLLAMPSPVRRVRHEHVGGFLTNTPPTYREIKAPLPLGPDGGYTIEDLIEALKKVEPDSWNDVGGNGSTIEFKGMLAVRQTREVHENVESLLNMLHEAGGIKEKVKVAR